jgi:hypothetical protein
MWHFPLPVSLSKLCKCSNLKLVYMFLFCISPSDSRKGETGTDQAAYMKNSWYLLGAAHEQTANTELFVGLHI